MILMRATSITRAHPFQWPSPSPPLPSPPLRYIINILYGTRPPPPIAMSTEQFRHQQRYEKCVRYASGIHKSIS
jgi:hypothetical protein